MGRILPRLLVFGLLVFGTVLHAQTPTPPRLSGIGGAGAVDVGQRVPMTPLFSGGVPATGLTYQWRKNGTDIGGATATTYVIESVVAGDAGTYAVAVSNGGGTSVATAELTVRAVAAIVFTTQPANRTVQVGQSTVFVTIVTGTFPRTFQWRKDGVDLPGATNASYAIPAVATSDAGSYTVVGTNPVGTTTSSAASLTVNAATPIAFFANSPSDVTFTHGAPGAFSVSLSAGSSPIAFQWLKNGTAVPGATTQELRFAAIAPADAGRYSVVATNPAGSATSREANLTVAPATPVSIGNHPVSASVFQGQTASFNVQVTAGSQPIIYQWMKNGTAIAGATNSGIGFNVVALGDAGSYTVVVTNAAGAVTSNAAVLTVTPAAPPAIAQQPVGRTIQYYENFFLSAQFTGTPPLTFEWKRDGKVVSTGRADYSVSNASPNDSGVYTLTIGNVAGSVTTTPATVVVNPPALPVITRHPASVQVPAGMQASFRVEYTAAGVGPVSFQWLKNGRPIPGADSSSFPGARQEYAVGNVGPGDEADYAVVLTAAGGSVTSQAARLTVLTASPPAVDNWPSGVFTNLGQNEQLNVRTTAGSPPLRIQWFKDGAPIAGATSETLYLNRIGESDLGLYSVTISNAGGVIASPDFPVRLYPAQTRPWIAAERQGNTVYFLATAPNRIERYDLTTERWLPTTVLGNPTTPTAMLPTPEGVYLAYGRALVRRSLDLATETPISNSILNIIGMFVTDQYLYYSTDRGPTGNQEAVTASLRRSTLEPGVGPVGLAVHEAVFAPGKRLVLGAYTGGSSLRTYAVDAQGQLGTPQYNYGLEQFAIGSRLFLFPGEEFVANGAGTIFRLSGLAYAGSFGDYPDDIAFLADGSPLVLRGRTLHTHNVSTFFETGRFSALPFRGQRTVVRGTDVFVFGAPAGPTDTAFQVARVSTGSIARQPLAVPVVGPTDRYSVDDAFLGDDGVVHILSRSKRALLRWSASTRGYIASVPLRQAPPLAVHTASARRAVFAYPDGQITTVPLRAGDAAEAQINTVGKQPLGLTDLGTAVLANASSSSYQTRDLRMVLDQQGQYLSFTAGNPADRRLGVGWEPTRRRFFSGPVYRYDPASLYFETVTAGGAIAGAAGSVSDVTAPVRFNADATLIATGNGRILDVNLNSVGVLANDILDAAWLPGDLYTVRALSNQTQVQRWARSNHVQRDAILLPGAPIRIFRLTDNQLAVVTSTLGAAAITLLNADLSIAYAPTAPSTPDFSGVYFADVQPSPLAPTGGELALYVRPDRSAVLLLRSWNYVATDVTINSDGSFLATATSPFGSLIGTNVSGIVSADGSLSGSFAGTGNAFTGARVSGNAATAGYYSAVAVNNAYGGAYAIVGGNGRAQLLAYGTNGSLSGTASVDGSGQFVVVDSTGRPLTATIDGSGAITATANRDLLGATRFMGVRDGVPRTDRLANISTRGRVGGGEDLMIAGFVVDGPSPRPVLIRAIGPALSGFGIAGAMADPKLRLFRGNTALFESDNWGSESAATSIVSVSTRVGAFPLSAAGRDAVLFASLEPGSYTAQVSAGTGAGGVSLVEVYDAGDEITATAPKLINIATRGRVGTGEDMLIAGIVVTGNVPKRLLVRAIGPALATFGVGNTLADPVLTLLSGQSVVATNDDWASSATSGGPTVTDLRNAAVSVGAFALPIDGRDATLLITLQPGNYTAQVSGKGSATGVALVEVYEVNN